MKRLLFTFNIHSIIDIITNSSSELFIGRGKSKENVEELIKKVYPNYLDEYEPLIHINEMTNSNFISYLEWAYSNWNDNLSLSNFLKIPPEELYTNWSEAKASNKYWFGDINENLIPRIKDIIDPNREMCFLYSIDENPNWEMQEELEGFMTRYHLG